jgi:O-6-methylguanine DNA methyltransferase
MIATMDNSLATQTADSGDEMDVGTGRHATVWTSTTIETPLGTMLAVAGDDGLVVLDFTDRAGLASDVERRRRTVGSPPITPGEHRHLAAARRQLADYFAGRRWTFDLPLRPIGTPFQRSAWAALTAIPPGQTRTYGQQAAAMGSPAAVRAVGRANGSNLLCVVVPCHRVIGSTGHLTGYAGGTDRKAWLLRHERVLT